MISIETKIDFIFAYRVPRLVADAGKGFLEDRRPASNFDPYLLTSALVRIIVLGETTLKNPYRKEEMEGEGKKGGGVVEEMKRGVGKEVKKVAEALQEMCNFH
jgi:glutamine synthetase